MKRLIKSFTSKIFIIWFLYNSNILQRIFLKHLKLKEVKKKKNLVQNSQIKYNLMAILFNFPMLLRADFLYLKNFLPRLAIIYFNAYYRYYYFHSGYRFLLNCQKVHVTNYYSWKMHYLKEGVKFQAVNHHHHHFAKIILLII